MKRPTCPTCEKPVDMAGNPNRPFCSERCQLIDLGRWLDESYSMPIEGEEDRDVDLSEPLDPDAPEDEHHDRFP